MSPDPLSPREVEALLQPDPRTHGADLLVLRDALTRMAGALEQLADAVGQLNAVADRLDRPDDERPRNQAPVIPPRVD